MCTVSFIARKRGYLLAMNRDEKRTRVAGLPPIVQRVNERAVLGPSEPGGGMWIAVNDAGVTLALINWYSIPLTASGHIVSRGEIVRTAGDSLSLAEVDSRLADRSLQRINPFRLMGFFPGERQVIEWQWNQQRLIRKKHDWRAQQWSSSGFNEPEAQRWRRRTFERAWKQKSAGTRDWLRRLHRSHSPQRGPFSTCMHRDDATTVSYTEIVVSARVATLRHLGNAPCQCHHAGMQENCLPLADNAYCPKTR